MTQLRRRMDDDMLARGLADRTRESYLWAVTGLAQFFHRSPDRISDEEVQVYLLHLLRDQQRSWSTCNIVLNELRFFYHTTLKQHRTTFTIPAPRHSGKLPVVLSRDEEQRLIAATPNLRQRTMLLTTYAAGLRLTEDLHLQVHDIDSARITIRVVQGKGGKDRYTVLSRACSRPSAHTSAWLGPAAGCFQRAVNRSARWIPPACRKPISEPNSAPVSPNPAGSTRCATVLRRTYWKPGRPPHDPALTRSRTPHDNHAVLSVDAAHAGGPRIAARSARSFRHPRA